MLRFLSHREVPTGCVAGDLKGFARGARGHISLTTPVFVVLGVRPHRREIGPHPWAA